MRRMLIAALFGLTVVIGWVGSADAVEFCLGIVGGGNIWRFEATSFANFVALHGRERVFEERASVGTAYVEPGGVNARLGFTTYVDSGNGVASVDLQLSLTTLNGPFRLVNVLGGASTGTMQVVACGPTTTAEPAGADLLK